jgi:hypothetical protein
MNKKGQFYEVLPSSLHLTRSAPKQSTALIAIILWNLRYTYMSTMPFSEDAMLRVVNKSAAYSLSVLRSESYENKATYRKVQTRARDECFNKREYVEEQYNND